MEMPLEADAPVLVGCSLPDSYHLGLLRSCKILLGWAWSGSRGLAWSRRAAGAKYISGSGLPFFLLRYSHSTGSLTLFLVASAPRAAFLVPPLPVFSRRRLRRSCPLLCFLLSQTAAVRALVPDIAVFVSASSFPSLVLRLPLFLCSVASYVAYI